MTRSFLRSRFVPAFLLLAAAFFAALHLHAASSAWETHLDAWRAQHEKALDAPDGWLTLVGLDWLEPGNNSFGSAPDNRIHIDTPAAAHLGILELQGDQVRLLPPPRGFPATLRIAGQPAHETLLTASSGQSAALTDGPFTFLIIHRGNMFALRVKNSDSPVRTHFHGLHWYAPDPRYRVVARWIPFVPSHTESIPTIIGTTLKLPVPGVAEFSLDGKTLRLEPVLEAPGSRQLFFILRDTTSHTTTYGAGRFLYTDFPDHGLDQPGQLVLDFNRLENPPCAYTPWATCPLPPLENRLAVALPAGEKRYSH